MDSASPHPEDVIDMAYISTGQLPSAETVQALVDEAHALFATNDEGHNASHYPCLLYTSDAADE